MNETWWSIFSDPHHIIAELAWTLIQDVVFGFIMYKLVWKKIIYPKLHAKFDKDHGIHHFPPMTEIILKDRPGVDWDEE